MSFFPQPDRGAGYEPAVAGAEVAVPPRQAHVPRCLDPVSFWGLADDEHRDDAELCPVVEAEYRLLKSNGSGYAQTLRPAKEDKPTREKQP